MKLRTGTEAIDFEAQQIDGTKFRLSKYRGSRILLSFFRNGACAMCNLRIHELISQHALCETAGIKIVALFESSVGDMVPYVGTQRPPFPLLADPNGDIYSMYGVECSEEKINNVIQHNLADTRIKQAAQKGFPLSKQVGSNFNRLPADFLISPDFRLELVHYSNIVVDHLPIGQVINAGTRNQSTA